MIFIKLIKIPIIGFYLRVLNNHVYAGDARADDRFAPICLWVKVLAPNISAVLLLLFITNLEPIKYYIAHGCFNEKLLSNFYRNPGSTILSVMPNLLGFGIGVYALLFAIGGDFIKKMHEHIKAKNETNGTPGSILVLNIDMAHPILVVLIAILLGTMQQIFPENKAILIISWFYFWYAIVSMFELIATLFDLVSNVLLDKI